MTRPLAVVAHPDLAHSRVNRAWTDVLSASGAVDVHVLSDDLTDGRINVPREQAQLAAHDRIILQCPIHWYSAPGILRDWLDEVLERGWAYGPGGHALEGMKYVGGHFLNGVGHGTEEQLALDAKAYLLWRQPNPEHQIEIPDQAALRNQTLVRWKRSWSRCEPISRTT
ncbi:NAD(P)H-dependent oxidoreductase [Amycolatopsis sp. NPDC050768]|uniref:NAD(P)H-dependent oxidoreductase n=1 Tax=Amycolatopsis sp. NPDC050768 TaxID=3154839 RepID=UPI0033EFD379